MSYNCVLSYGGILDVDGENDSLRLERMIAVAF